MALSKSQHQKNYIKKNREFLVSLKNKPCADCKVQYPPYVMDFDHAEGSYKEYVVAWMPARFGRKKILAEISKCDLVCSNCHRIRTHERKKASLAQ